MQFLVEVVRDALRDFQAVGALADAALREGLHNRADHSQTSPATEDATHGSNCRLRIILMTDKLLRSGTPARIRMPAIHRSTITQILRLVP
jgi:hypothetical protein